MSVYEVEQFFACPHCGAEVSALLDPTVPAQTYVEDCEVCCRPIQLTYRASGGAITDFTADPVEQ